MAVTTPAVGEIADGVTVSTPPELVMVGAEEYTTSFGVRKLVWLRILKNSARNCSASARDVRILCRREIQLRQPRPGQRIALHIAVGAVDGVAAAAVRNAHRWLDKGVRVEVFAGRARIEVSVEALGSNSAVWDCASRRCRAGCSQAAVRTESRSVRPGWRSRSSRRPEA